MWHFLFLRKGVTGHMEKLVKVAVDAMGGDHAPGEVVKGAVDAVNEKNNLKVFLVGKAPRIHEELSKYQYKNEQIEVVNAEEEISCDESPVEAIRKKKDSSMVVALKMVKDKTADAFVSAGSSGAILVGGQFVVGRIKGIKRAPLGAVMPTAKGPMLLVDAGANMDAKAEYLLQFAQMGSIYMEDVLGIKAHKWISVFHRKGTISFFNCLVNNRAFDISSIDKVTLIVSVSSGNIRFCNKSRDFHIFILCF